MIESTTFSAFPGLASKYSFRRWRELNSGVPYSSPPFQKLAPSARALSRAAKDCSREGGLGFHVNPFFGLDWLVLLYGVGWWRRGQVKEVIDILIIP